MSKTGKAANKENSKSKRNSKRGSRIKVDEHAEVEEPSVKPKQVRKRKSKVSFSEDVELANNSIVKEEMDDEGNESDSQDECIEAKEISKHEAEQNEVVPNWPQSDLKELIRRIEEALPEVDLLSFSTRVGRLKWESICFNNYTSEECKNTWLYIQKRVRRFRLLGEMLQDAKQWISKPWTSFYGGIKTNKHPDMPKKPLSLFLRFYINQKSKVYRDNPGMEMTKVTGLIAQMYKSMSPTKREKFIQEEAEERKEYIEKLEEFYNSHPEYPRPSGRVVEKARTRAIANPGPKKPQTPFNLYFEEQLKSISDTSMHRDEFKLQCKDNWRAMPDKGKIIWINKALDMEVRFHEELKDYLNNNPSYTAGIIKKPILNKDEKLIRERMAGKPTKPPSSAYSLFSSEVLKGDEIKKVDAKERLKEVSLQWKNCSETRKDHYRQEVNRLMEEYKLNFSNYLETLPEDQRQEELQNHLPKRKAPVSSRKTDENTPARKKKKLAVAVEIVPKIESPPSPVPSPIPSPVPVVCKKYADEPVQPPVDAFALFSLKYAGKKSVREAWNNLKRKEKLNLEDTLEKIKRQYLKEYVKFLKNLSKEELKEYKILKTERDAAITNKANIKEENTDDSDIESDSDNESSDINDDDDIEEDDDDDF